MQLRLNISEDEELRKFIKSQIMGQVLSISRNEIRDLMKKEMSTILLGMANNYSYGTGHYDRSMFVQDLARLVKNQAANPESEKLKQERSDFTDAFVENYNKKLGDQLEGKITYFVENYIKEKSLEKIKSLLE